MSEKHYSGYIHLFGNPNVGKSSLVKGLCNQKLTIISNLPQTTRHRIFVIFNDETHQAIFSDAPGTIKQPKYKLQERMNQQAHSGLKDADVLLFCTTPEEPVDETLALLFAKVNCPVFLVINKLDLFGIKKAKITEHSWKSIFDFSKTFIVSALDQTGIQDLKSEILSTLPEGPAYYPKEDLSDRHERFFVAEIIRETIFENYYDEIPYSCEVQVQDFKEELKEGKPFAKIYTYIIVERESQKGILLGQNGKSIKELGIQARHKIEEFLGHQVYLDLQIKTEPNWRDNPDVLKKYGY